MSSSPRTPTRGPGTGPEAIVGRRRELEALGGWLQAARGGAGRLVLCVGEPGIGKSRLAQEFAGLALAVGCSVAWGRCPQTEGAPPFWPWRQVLRSLGVDADRVLSTEVASPADRFRVFDDVSESVLAAADGGALVVVLDDVHWADEPSLLTLRHLAARLHGRALLVLATFRDVEPAGFLPTVLPDLYRSPAVERVELTGLDLPQVREQLSRAGVARPVDRARTVLDLTGGNPLFVREVARAMVDGTWRPDRPPRGVVDVVRARLDRVSDGCRRLVQAAAIVGRDFPPALVARVLGEPVAAGLPVIDEAIAHGLIDPVGHQGLHRFVHALTREAVEGSLPTATRLALHRAAAEAIEEQFASDLRNHLGEIAGHWSKLAPYGEADTARGWTVRAADEAARQLAFEDAVRLFRAALAMPATPLADVDRCRVLTGLARAAYLAGDLAGCTEAAAGAAEAARGAGSPELLAEATLVLQAGTDPRLNAVAEQLCEQALSVLGDTGYEAVRARLLAQRSHLALYDGDQDRVRALSAAALDLAGTAGDDGALMDALHARKEALPGPSGRAERLRVATEMLVLAHRRNDPRAAMWGSLWRIDALTEAGRIAAARDELPALRMSVEGAGGPINQWHLDRVTAFLALAQGRSAEAAAIGRRAYDRMRVVEPRPARGAYFMLQCTLAEQFGIPDDAAEFVRQEFEPLPLFRTIGPLHRALLLLGAGLADEAAAAYQRAGPLDAWQFPPFHVLHTYASGVLAAAALGRHDDLAVLLERLGPFRGEHVVAESVAYRGPVALALGRGALALGRLDEAVDDLAAAADQGERAGASAFVAEARYWLATALVARNRPGDAARASSAAGEADRLVRALGMTAYRERTGALVAYLGPGPRAGLSPRELEVARLVAEGLTNRQIGARLVISERTAQNHVQHILTKLGFTARSQIAAWVAGVGR